MEILGMPIILDGLSLAGLIIGAVCIVGVICIARTADCKAGDRLCKRCRGFGG